MSAIEELMREKLAISGAEPHIAAAQIVSTQIEDGAIAASDIANDAVTAAKIEAACLGNGLTGGAGTAISIDADEATMTANDGGKVGVNALGVALAHLGASTKGAGLVAGGGTAFVVSPDTTTVELAAGVVQLVDAGTNLAALEATAKKHTITRELPDFVAGAPNTEYFGIMAVPVGKSYTIERVELAAYAVGNDADGIMTFRLVNFDVDAGPAADEEIVAAWDTEALVAQTGTSMAVITAAGVNVLEAHDYLFVELTSNSAAIDAQHTNFVCTIEYTEIT